MTFTYSATNISTDLAKVRLQISDTVSSDALLTDEEIAYAISDEPNLVAAAARCAEIILSKFARDFNWTADGTTIDKVARTKLYKEMADDLRGRSSRGISSLNTRNDDGWQGNRNIDHQEVSTTLQHRTTIPE